MTIEEIKFFLKNEIEICDKNLDDLFATKNKNYAQLIFKEMTLKYAYKKVLERIENEKGLH